MVVFAGRCDDGEVALIPGTGGVFDVRANSQLLWSRKTAGRFPDIKELKRSSETTSPLARTWATPIVEPHT